MLLNIIYNLYILNLGVTYTKQEKVLVNSNNLRKDTSILTKAALSED